MNIQSLLDNFTFDDTSKSCLVALDKIINETHQKVRVLQLISYDNIERYDVDILETRFGLRIHINHKPNDSYIVSYTSPSTSRRHKLNNNTMKQPDELYVSWLNRLRKQVGIGILEAWRDFNYETYRLFDM